MTLADNWRMKFKEAKHDPRYLVIDNNSSWQIVVLYKV